jgi:nitronate monooxygenase
VGTANPFYKRHLEICIEGKVPLFITSLGSPKEVIERAKAYGGKVLCDVTNIKHADKCYDLGCDGFIAVSQGAGGHAGPHPMPILIRALKLKYPDKLVVAAGGIADGYGILSAMSCGASGVSIGTRFIASTEAPVNKEYKDAIVSSGMEDIVMTTRLSGTPCSVINTPFAKKIGYDQNWFEKILLGNRRTKKLYKSLVQYKGMKWLESSVHPGSYKTLWTAGQSVELIKEIKSCSGIIKDLAEEMVKARKELNAQFNLNIE